MLQTSESADVMHEDSGLTTRMDPIRSWHGRIPTTIALTPFKERLDKQQEKRYVLLSGRSASVAI
jgi:hypothetical protein